MTDYFTIVPEVEVFRICTFEPDKIYHFALYTRKEGKFPNEKYYTKNPLTLVGTFIRTERWGYHDNGGAASYFEYNGDITRIEYDYDGKTCFVSLDG